MAQVFNSNIKNVALAYKRLLKLKITDSSLLRDIEENPFYPSLLSISNTFDRYHVNNSAFVVPIAHFGELEAPFIAFLDLTIRGTDFVLVTKITNSNVSFLYDKKRPETIEKDHFIKRFKNIVLIAQPDENSCEKDYSGQLKKENSAKKKQILRLAAIVVIAFFITMSNMTSSIALAFIIISLIKLAGLSGSVILLAYEIDKSNVFVKSICTAGLKTNCDAVLNSKAAKVWGISWSEIGFFYFAFTSLVLFVPGLLFSYKIAWLSFVNAFTAPYILFSIYYQWRITKQWCPLCLTMQTILAMELAFSIVYFWIPVHSILFLISADIMPLLLILSFILLPIVIWYGLKPFFLKAKDCDQYRNAYKRLQFNPDIFNSLLVQQVKAVDKWQNLGITIGNPNADKTIIKVCSPYCGPCADVHPILEELIKQNKNLNLKVIFTGSYNEYDNKTPIVRHLLAIAAENDISKTQEALDDWYLSSTKDYAVFAARYPMNGELKLQDAKIEAMNAWCIKAEITQTPTIFVDGYRLPENYNIEDLKYIL